MICILLSITIQINKKIVIIPTQRIKGKKINNSVRGPSVTRIQGREEGEGKKHKY